MSDFSPLRELAELAMGETIVAADCDGLGFPVFSADTGDAPWNWSSKIKKINRAGTIVVGARGSIGFPRAPDFSEFGATQTTITVTPNRKRILPAYLFQALSRVDFQAISAQQAIPMLTVSELSEVKIRNLDLSQQAYIATILGALDAVIYESRSIVEKILAAKRGLLNDLLTRGIDANGELRRTHKEAPHLYKQSKLGWIPNAWNDLLLGGMLKAIDAGWSPSCPEEPPNVGEWGVLKVSAITSGKYVPSESKRLPSNLKPVPAFEVQEGDVLLARANGVAELVATTVLVGSTQPRLMLSDKTLRLVPFRDRLTDSYLAHAMSSSRTRMQVNGMLNGSSGQQNISQAQIRRLCIPVPPLDEQCEGMIRVGEIDKRIESESSALAKFRKIRSGLMDDLLTGRVRVTPLLDTALP